MLCYNLVVLLFKYVSCLNNVCIWTKYYYIDLMFHIFTKNPMEQYRNQKYFDVLIFYVVLIVYSFCCLANYFVMSSSPLGLSSCQFVMSFVLLFCRLVYLFCYFSFHFYISVPMLFAIIYFIIWPCLKRTGNNQIQEFDWLKSILTAV